MRTSNGLYALLQVLPDADPEVIEAAYKALMKKHHPDRQAGEHSERRAAEINHAFNVLRDPERRAAYDADERARLERHRVELARAFPESPAGGDSARRMPVAAPSRFQPPPRPGQRAAAWVGAAGAAMLAGTIILFARGAPEAPRADAAELGPTMAGAAADASTADTSPAAAPVPFRDQPVSRRQVERAVAEFRRISAAAGLQGAAGFSERCFASQGRTLSVSDFDFCVAFDHAASRLDLAPPAPGRQALRRFEPQNQVARHVRAADPIADTFSSIELRLFEIRRLTDSVIAELNVLASDTSGMAAEAPAAIAQRPRSAIAAHMRHAPARTPPPAMKRSEQDFLEREGGIY